ncbi:MAG TPA: aminotransferase class V-fold PLP-dependent enzyme [Mycobacteriales bacterium]|nr:aminotransferase class V-fold PLP-dependent enzyme [Mycobacteriales bacterium]
MSEQIGAAWRAAREPAAVRHLDHAACSRPSLAVREAVARHAQHEAETGGYVAQAAAEPVLQAGRTALAALMGMTGPDDVAFVESAQSALRILLEVCPLPPGARVLNVTSDYGPAVAMLRGRGLEVRSFAGDALPDAIRNEPPALVHVTHLASHRGAVAPVAEILAAAQEAGVPTWIDAAQSIGHLEIPRGASVVYATSRKWLAGPRGVGVVAVHPDWAGRLQPTVTYPYELPPVQDALESQEAHVAGRVGLCVAVGELAALGPANVHAALADVGSRTRAALDGVAGWTLAVRDEVPSAIVSLRPPDGVDVAEVRARLLREHAILTTTAGPDRAPADTDGTYLRVSPHVDVNDDDLDAVAKALVALT